MNSKKYYDILIIGAGVSGAAEAYALGAYTDVKRVALIEKEQEAGSINSSPVNNSQTLHEGDIETNYSLEKAKKLEHKASYTRTYLEGKTDPLLYMKGPKMVLGVGKEEVATLRKRFASFKGLYPMLTLLERDELAQREPMIVKGRSLDEEIVALYNPEGVTVNYGKLAMSLLEDARSSFGNQKDRTLDTFFGSTVRSIKKTAEGYSVVTDTQILHTRFLSVAAGAHSMYFAKHLGIEEAQHLSLLLVAGNFYYSPKYLNSKVYTVQNPKLPFSAVHGDPDILQDDKTRYGPTTRLVLTLERHQWNSVLGYLAVIQPLFRSLIAYMRILFDRDFFWYTLKNNVLFSLPFLGRYLFAREIKKIIPSLDTGTVVLAEGQGGVRPQIVDTRSKSPLSLGEAKLYGDHAFFNVTPSPGATTSIFNGLVDVYAMTEVLGARFFTDRVAKDFKRQF